MGIPLFAEGEDETILLVHTRVLNFQFGPNYKAASGLALNLLVVTPGTYKLREALIKLKVATREAGGSIKPWA
jgi:hypothetical protein